MSKSLPQRFQIVFRLVILFGVLAGLLFSCGEGIRLFPFPAAEIIGEKQSRLKDGEETGYQKNIHRFEKGEGNYQSRLQRESRHHQWTDVFKILKYSPFSASAIWGGIDFLFDSQSFKSRFPSASLGSRAPPFS